MEEEIDDTNALGKLAMQDRKVEMPHDADDMAPMVWMMILIITEK